jgi:hypothetical protein
MRLIREEGTMCALKRERWTEAEIDNLPPGEHDYFDRKSGRLFESTDFEVPVAKALCAFANSGGGHLILGINNDGSPDGLPLLKGRTPVREWLEQKIPRLIDLPLQDFRVHEVERAAASKIPSGRGVFVIDVGDSALAPHQSAIDHVHYYRQGGHSIPAPTFYLELLRQRLTAPRLGFELTQVEIVLSQLLPDLWLTLRLTFLIRNYGRVAAYRWRIRGTGHDLPTNLAANLFLDPLQFPQVVGAPDGSVRDATILPGDSRSDSIFVGFHLPPAELGTVAEDVLSSPLNAKITFRMATEMSPGEDVPVVIGEKLSIAEVRARVP